MTQEETGTREGREPWPETAARLANTIAHYPMFNRKDLAELRRMDPEEPDAPAFWRLTNRHQLGRSPENERSWGLILHGIALMTPNTNTEGRVRSAHNPRVSVGTALFQGNDPSRKHPLCQEQRLEQLTNSRGKPFRRNLTIILRTLGQNEASLDWRELARLILDEEQHPDRRKDHITKMARDFYRAEYKAGRES